MADSRNDDVTTGELGRRLDGFRSDVRDDLKEIRESISALSFVPVDRYDPEQAAQDKAIKSLEDHVQRQAEQRATDRRIAVTSLVLPIVVAVVTALLLAQIGSI